MVEIDRTICCFVGIEKGGERDALPFKVKTVDTCYLPSVEFCQPIITLLELHMYDIVFVAALTSVAIGAVSYLAIRRIEQIAQREQAQRLKEVNEALRKSLSESFRKVGDEYFWQSEYVDARYGLNEYLWNNYVNTTRNLLAHHPKLETKADIREEVNAAFDELKKRIDAIEARFPEQDKLEKIASVNDAILGTQLEAMSESIKAIQDEMLTKWDVAKVVFAILGSLGAIAAIVFGILNWAKP